MSWRGAKVAWCTRCNGDRAIAKHGRYHHCLNCGDRVEMPHKSGGGFNAEPKVGPYSGKMRDSKAEANREPVLQAWANAGQITDLVYGGPRFALEVYGTQAVDALLMCLKGAIAFGAGLDKAVPRETGLLDPPAPTVTMYREPLEQIVADVERSRRLIGHYTPDATYRNAADEPVAEDVKGWKISRDFPLRAKLMEVCHNLPVTVIREQRGVQQRARGAGVKGRGVGARLMGGR